MPAPIDQFNALVGAEIKDLTVALEAWSQSIHADYYFHVRPYDEARSDRSNVLASFSQEWKHNYITAREHRFDPVVLDALSSVGMLIWSRDRPPQDAAAAQVMERRYKEGCCTGIGVPVRGPAGQFSILSFWACDETGFHAAVRCRGAELHALAVYCHAAIYAQRQSTHSLSPIEIECIRWTAQGKTAWEISVLMSLPERTIHYHIGEASRKLGAPNKTAATCIALRAGLLEPWRWR